MISKYVQIAKAKIEAPLHFIKQTVTEKLQHKTKSISN